MFRHIQGVELQLVQIIKRIDVVQLAGVNQAHIDIANPSAVAGFVEKGIFAEKNCLLERAFADVMPTARLCRVGAIAAQIA